MSTYATVRQLAIWVGRAPVDADESDQWQMWLDTIEDDLRAGFARAGYDLDTQVAAGDPTATRVVGVECEAARRKIDNPTGARTKSETKQIDDFSHTTSETVDAAGSTGALYVSDDELAKLLPDAADLEAFTITPSYQPG